MTGGSDRSTVDHRRAAAVVVGSTFALTMAFIGALAFLEGATRGVTGRVPWYFVAAGALFVAVIFLLETQTDDGRSILFTALVVSFTGFVVVVFGSEGLVFALRRPGEVLVSRLVLYFVAAGLLATGFAYWTLNHWREFTTG